MGLAYLSLPTVLVVFVGSATAIGFAGTRLAHVADALAASGPEITVFHVHPASVASFAIHAIGIRLLAGVRDVPMWQPVDNPATVMKEEQAKAMPADPLAVGDIVGGNAFEVLFLAAADFVYSERSIHHAFTAQNVFTAATVILMTGVLILGMLREPHGPANIGGESASILVLYVMSAAVLVA